MRRQYGREMDITGVIAHTPWNLVGWGTLEFGYEHSHKMESG